MAKNVISNEAKFYRVTEVVMPTSASSSTVFTVTTYGVKVPSGKHCFVVSFQAKNANNNNYYQFPVGAFNLYKPDCWIMQRTDTQFDIRLSDSGVAALAGQPTIIDFIVI